MSNLSNPFKPTKPVYSSVFRGRYEELDRIDKVLSETKNGNPTNLLFVGERGIGKTSLLLYAKFISNGDMEATDDIKYHFLTVFLSIDKKLDTSRFIQKLNTEIQRQLRSENDLLQRVKDAWGFVKRLEISGIKLNDSQLQDCVDSTIYSIIDTTKLITSNSINKKDGLVIFIDEADNAPEELELGSFLKLMSEKLISENCNNVLFILAGLPEVRNKLRESHQSSLRLFEELELKPLSKKDTKEVILSGLREVKENNGTEVKITDEAIDVIYAVSEGYPHFIQQLGYTAFEFDDDNIIESIDIQKATAKAIKIIGDRYYKDLFYNKILSDSYREVLIIMADFGSNWITKDEIRKKFKGADKTLNNAISALKNRNIILRKEGVKGFYRLQWLAFALWIKAFTQTLPQSDDIF